MKDASPVLFESLEAIIPPDTRPVVLTIGTFDGVHRGHLGLVELARSRAAALGGVVVALTFQNHPREVVAPALAPQLLTAWPRKQALLRQAGVEWLVGLRFDESLALMNAGDFIREAIVGRLRARCVISGANFAFGRGARGNPAMLAAEALRQNFEYLCAPSVELDGVPVSSSRIREALRLGDVAAAARMIGRPHRIDGVVVTGDRLGRTIGFPTANLVVDPRLQLPADGVYAVQVELEDGRAYAGMMNFGTRPTVGGREFRSEVHLLDFDEVLVGQRLQVDLLARLRSEQKFESLDHLQAQLAKDRIAAGEVAKKPCPSLSTSS
jgi:riboflavin kinase/FMN adenylyltransferase